MLPVGIGIGVIVLFCLGIFLYVKCKLNSDEENFADDRDSLPTYEDATKDDLPNYNQIDQNQYVVRTSETVVGLIIV